MERFVVCRPQGGLNDNLNQIELCWHYCNLTGRTLVVDTTRSGGFGLPFGFFFRPAQASMKTVFHPSFVFMAKLNAMTARPACVSGRLNSYQASFDPACRNFVEQDTRVRVTFDMRKDHPEPVLVHHQCNGGQISVNCLARLRLTDDFKRDVIDRIAPLKSAPYSAIVIRNSSDYQTDFQAVLARVHPEVVGKRLLVCSDDYQVLAHAKATLSDVDVLELPDFVHTNGMPAAAYALQAGARERYLLTLKAVCDLIALAQSEKLFLTKINKTAQGYEYSGFTTLSGLLHQNKGIVARLLGVEGGRPQAPV